MYRPYNATTQLHLVSNTNYVVYLNDHDKVIDVSNNFEKLFSITDPKGRSLSELLQISEETAHSLLNQIRQKQTIADYKMLGVFYKSNLPRDTYVNGATVNPHGEYMGCILALRTLFEDDYTLNNDLNEYQRDMISNLLNLSSSRVNKDIKGLLLDYHLAYLKQYYNRVLQAGGPQLGEAFLDHLQIAAKRNQWKLEFNGEDLIASADYELSMLREALPAMRKGGEEFASQIVGPKITEDVTRSVTADFSEADRKNVEFHSM